MKNRGSFVLMFVSLMILSLLCAYGAQAASSKPIVLRAGSTWEESLVWNDSLRVFAKIIEEKSKGEIKVKFAGGPETFPTFESTEMLRKGVIDVLFTSTTFYTKALPASFTTMVSEISAEQERQSGYYAALNELHKKYMDVVYLGRMDDLQYVFAFKKPLNSPDMRGLKIRGLPFSLNLIKAMGGSPIVIAPPELYSALEKGVVDGYAWPTIGHVERKFPEICKYMLDYPYYRVSCVLLMNKRTYDRLPPHLQKMITDVMPLVEKEARAKQNENLKKERAELAKEGVKFITWKPADVKQFYGAVRKSGKEEALRVSPDQAPALLKMITK